MIRFKVSKIMHFIMSFILIVSVSSPVSALAGLYDDLEAWKNEGIFTPLTPFTSYEWNEPDYSDFSTKFEAWSNGMEQKYYRMTAQSDASAEHPSQASFNGKVFEELLKTSEFENYKVGFTYHNQDFRSDYDRYRVDVFAMYASEVSYEKHLYTFGIDEDCQDKVLYTNGAEVLNDGPDFSFTQNDELQAMTLGERYRYCS